MGNYMPTTDGVRDTYVRAMRAPGSRAEFDRWLAAHDKEIAAAKRELGDAEFRAYYRKQGEIWERDRIVKLLNTRHEDYAITGHREDDCFTCEHIALIKGEKQ